MNNRKIRKNIFEKIKTQTSAHFEKHGFKHITKANWTGKYLEDAWENRKSWQKEEIRILYNPHTNILEIDFSIYLLMGDGRGKLFDGQTLSYLAHKKPFYQLPSKIFCILLNKRIDFFVNGIAKDISQHFDWFSEHNTPEKCMGILLKEKEQNIQNRNGFGKSFADEAIKFLSENKDKA